MDWIWGVKEREGGRLQSFCPEQLGECNCFVRIKWDAHPTETGT